MQLDEQQQASLLEMQVRLELKKLELSKTEVKLNCLREDWLARVEELRSNKSIELSEKDVLEESLASTLTQEQQDAERELKEAKGSFDVEMSALSDEKNDLNQQRLTQKKRHEEEEISLRDKSLQLSTEIYLMCTDHSTTLNSHESKIEGLKVALEQGSSRRLELEEHFALVDRNNAAIKFEEEQLQRIAKKEEEAKQLLHQGARGLQKLFRGLVARKLVDKLKKQKSKKKAKKGKGKVKQGK